MNFFAGKLTILPRIICLMMVLYSTVSISHTQDKNGKTLTEHNALYHKIGAHPDYPDFDKNLICPDGELTDKEENNYQAMLPTGSVISSQREKLASLLDSHNLGDVPPAPIVRDSLVKLGRYLAFDKLLSGNRDIACMSCHHPNVFTGDERMLGFGTGAHSTPEAKERGRIALGLKVNETNEFSDRLLSLGTDRTGYLDTVISRHTPPLYNLHAYDNLFWDGRIEYQVATEVSTGPFYARDSSQLMRRVSSVSVDGYANNGNIKIFNEYRSKGTVASPIWKNNQLIDSDVVTVLGELKFLGEIEQVSDNATLYEVSTPAGDELKTISSTLEFGIVSALPLFPMLSHVEMIGKNLTGYEYPKDGSCPSSSENDIAASSNEPGSETLNVWTALIKRLSCEAPDYLVHLSDAYPDVDDWTDVNAGHIANAIAGYMIDEFSSSNTPLSEFRKAMKADIPYQDIDVLTRGQVLGAIRFIEVGCANCHSGPLFSDFDFHNTGLPQLGPGKLDDIDTMNVMLTPQKSNAPNDGNNLFTGDLGRKHHQATADKFTFRTSPLINVAETWTRGHAGQYLKLDDFIEHYRDPITAYVNYGQCFSGPLGGQVGGATTNGSDSYGFAAANGVGSELLAMHWDSEGKYNEQNPHDDEIITTLDVEVKNLTNTHNGTVMTRLDVKAISQFLNALTSKEVCDNSWPLSSDGRRDVSNDPTNASDPYYHYQQAVVSPPIMKRIKKVGSSGDGSSVLFNRNSVKDIPRIETKNNSYSYIDLSHPISGLPVDWFYRVACAAN